MTPEQEPQKDSLNDDLNTFNARESLQRGRRCFPFVIILLLALFVGQNINLTYRGYQNQWGRAQNAYSILQQRTQDFIESNRAHDAALRAAMDGSPHLYGQLESLRVLNDTVLTQCQQRSATVQPPAPATGIMFWRSCVLGTLNVQSRALMAYTDQLTWLIDNDLNHYIDANKEGLHELFLARLRHPLSFDALHTQN